MALEAVKTPEFLRKTTLRACERNTNFTMIDDLALEVVTSVEADQVTPLMSKVYLRLIQAPSELLERERVLRFVGEISEEGKQVKAWTQLCRYLRVSSETANKALGWLHERGVIGYYAGKNGVGIRIFLNRAASSIRVLPTDEREKKLPSTPASPGRRPASAGEPAFNDSFAVEEEVSDSDFNSPAPKNGAADKTRVDKNISAPQTESENNPLVSVDEIIRRIRNEIEPAVESAAQRAAHREHEKTREWLESKGLPKAARVAQREAYNVLRQNGVVSPKGERARADLQVGRNDYTPTKAQPLSPDEIKTYAEMCVAMVETHGQAIDLTLSELSSETGGPILPDDAPRVREVARTLVDASMRGGE